MVCIMHIIEARTIYLMLKAFTHDFYQNHGIIEEINNIIVEIRIKNFAYITLTIIISLIENIPGNSLMKNELIAALHHLSEVAEKQYFLLN